jgi:tight adherence protein C
MSTVLSGTGALLGLTLGLGLLLVWAGLPMHRRIRLADRVLPYLKDTPRPSRLLEAAKTPGGVLSAVAAPVVADLGRRVDRLLGGTTSVRHRLMRAGEAPDVERFRAGQVLWAAAGAVGGAAFGMALYLNRDSGSVTVVMLTLIGAGLGLVWSDYALTRRAVRREARILAEFPTVAELLALAVGAGEGAVGALERVCRLSRGELSDELRRALADARAGANLPTAMQGVADRTGLVGLARFVDGIIVAVERGTPLADVLRAQAADVREEGRRSIMDEGGKREIAMMVPVVFLILPVTVVFAVFPGFAFLRLTL